MIFKKWTYPVINKKRTNFNFKYLKKLQTPIQIFNRNSWNIKLMEIKKTKQKIRFNWKQNHQNYNKNHKSKLKNRLKDRWLLL
jgi:hypothetical protein